MCVHEPEPALVKEARAYVRGQLPREDLVLLLRKTRQSADPSLRYGESNARLSFMIDALMEAFPDASFVWLIRNGMATVASFLARPFYRDDIPQSAPRRTDRGEYRLRADEVGDMSAEQWRKLSPFAKTCWAWNWQNRKIQRDLERLHPKWMFVRLEDLSSRLGEIASFLGTHAPPGVSVPVSNVAVTTVTRYSWWDRGQRSQFR